MIITLAGKPRRLEEPVFKQLKIIISVYNQLANTTDATAQQDLINTLLTALTPEKIRVKRLKAGELNALLTALPDLCQLKTVDNDKMGKPFQWGNLYAHLSSTYG